MAHIHKKHDWQLPESSATSESAFMNRRRFLASMGTTTMATAGALSTGFLGSALMTAGPASLHAATLTDTLTVAKAMNARRNPAFKVNKPITPIETSGQYNNFYEFSRAKDDVWELAQRLTTRPWAIEVGGLAHKPQTFDVEELIRAMPVEERVYRFRCVEAWSMVVPWVGFPLSALLKKVEPMGSATFVKFSTFLRPKEAPRQNLKSWYGSGEPWPYTEGLSLAEAMNDLTMMTVGAYGRRLPNQFGAPIRLIIPWKYGFKNIKSIVKIELTDKQPPTFWNTIQAREYGFVSNVDPKVPHPRWSQAFERDIGTRDRIPTLPFNGYGEQVAQLYRS